MKMYIIYLKVCVSLYTRIYSLLSLFLYTYFSIIDILYTSVRNTCINVTENIHFTHINAWILF